MKCGLVSMTFSNLTSVEHSEGQFLVMFESFFVELAHLLHLLVTTIVFFWLFFVSTVREFRSSATENNVDVMEDDKIYVAVGEEIDERISTLKSVLMKFRGRTVCVIHVHVPAHKILLPSGAEIPVCSLGDTELQKFRDCERQNVQKILDDCSQFCASFQVSSENICIEKKSITEGLLELISKHKIRILVMGASMDDQYSRRRMMPPLLRKAKYVLHHAPDYCHVWFVFKYQLIYTRECLNQPATDCEEIPLTLQGHLGKLDRLLQTSFSNAPTCSQEAESSPHSSYWLSFTKSNKRLGVDIFEMLYYEEYNLRKTLEEELAKGKEENENIKRLWNFISPKLHESLDKQMLLESQVIDYDANVKEPVERIVSAAGLLQKFKNKSDKYEIERDNALHENEELKKLVAQGPSYSHFSYSELQEATNHFDPKLIIEEGRYWSTYKGSLSHTEVAIKVFYSSSTLRCREYDIEVAILRKLRHPKIVTFIGVCPEHCALVYEYLPGGSLEDRLLRKNNSPPLNWQTRVDIANDICSALIFMHSSQTNFRVVHGHLLPSNVLLDHNFSAKLSHFGINTVISDNDFVKAKLTPKYDTYCFGRILFHLLTGSNKVEVAMRLKRAVLGDNIILDDSAGDWPFVQAQRIAELALQCCDYNLENRPDLATKAWDVLQSIKVFGCGLSALKSRSEQAPHHFLCPISMEIMKDPHIACDGHTYDGNEIQKWLQSGHNTSPMTGVPLKTLDLIPNHSLRSAIQEWLQPGAAPRGSQGGHVPPTPLWKHLYVPKGSKEY